MMSRGSTAGGGSVATAVTDGTTVAGSCATAAIGATAEVASSIAGNQTAGRVARAAMLLSWTD